MRIGMMGLGRMGANITRRLARHGHRCVVVATALAEDEGPAEYSGDIEKGQAGTGSVEKPRVENRGAH
jgi:6-phosphogluconate dehydrogenase